ncbi:MAG: dihydrofolate reductase [Hyphomicrobiales bacterium]
MISIITALAENNAIGKDNDLPWHLPADLKYFMNTTKGHRIVMGRKTFESINSKPLPRRENVIITKNTDFKAEGVTIVHSIEEAVKLCKESEETFICGGSYIYKEMLPHTDRLYLTRIHKNFDAETFFPEIDFSKFNLVSENRVDDDPKADFSYSFQVWERIL